MNKTIRHFGWGLLLAGSCFFLSCVGDGEGVDVNGIPESDDTQPAYAAVQAIFTSKCTVCHTGLANGQLDLTAGNSYDMLINATTAAAPTVFPTLRVVPFSPDSSFLYEKISSDTPKGSTNRMPMNAPALSQSDIDIIAAWITCGAPAPTDVSVCPGVND